MDLTKKAKIILGSVGAGVVVLGAGLGIWQPWNQPVVDNNNTDLQPDQNMTEVTKPEVPEEEPLTLLVGGNEIECTLYEGDGWSIYVPVDWVVQAGENGGIFYAPGDAKQTAQLAVIRSLHDVYLGDFVSASPQHLSDTETWKQRAFHSMGLDGGWEVICQAPEAKWNEYQKLMTAMARTFTVEGDMLFSGFSPVASEPEWQISDGVTVMWMDKDGYIVDDVAEEHVVTTMLAWDNDYKMNFTGQYSLDPFWWSGSYTCVPGKEYIDMFRSQVRYEVADGKAENITLSEGMSITDGWLSEGGWLDVVIYHDGSAIKDVEIVKAKDYSAGTAQYLSDLVANDTEVSTKLSADECTAFAAIFNNSEYNGLLRFPYEVNAGVGDYLDVLFYDLGEPEDTFTDEEKAALEAAGVMMELDVTRLTRDYLVEYLDDKLGISNGETLLDTMALNGFGTYLEEYDAWYISRGDTMLTTYTFDRGEFHPSNGGCVKLYYTAPHLFVMDTDGLFNEPMVLTLRYTEDGRWAVCSNVQEIYA